MEEFIELRTKKEELEKRVSILYMLMLVAFSESMDAEKSLYSLSPEYLKEKMIAVFETDYERLESLLHPEVCDGKLENRESIYEKYKKIWRIW